MPKMSAPSAPGSIVPAQLGFLTIFNPTLGNTDETIEDQIVYYASVTTQAAQNKRRRTRGQPAQNISPEERNERLRQIGLAQGMASFSRGFASGSTVDTIDTEKSRVILHELEPGWWILAVRYTNFLYPAFYLPVLLEHRLDQATTPSPARYEED